MTIAHQPRDLTSRYALCAAPPLTMDTATCDLFKHLHWDRPHDISAVINGLERLNAAGEFRGQIDLLRIAVGGHSAGSSGALSVAGALRNFTGPVLDMHDGRPVAFLALSPQGPGGEGFFDTDFKKPAHSWMSVDRPVLLGTGDGDNVCHRSAEPGTCVGDSPYVRRIGFERPPAGNKYQIYIHDADIFHTLFELNTADCAAKNVDQGKCDKIVSVRRRTVLKDVKPAGPNGVDYGLGGASGGGERAEGPGPAPRRELIDVPADGSRAGAGRLSDTGTAARPRACSSEPAE